MQETRKLFHLNISEGINPLEIMQPLQFKGATKISSESITAQQILDCWSHNKSVICYGNVPNSFKGLSTEIFVTSKPSPTKNNIICTSDIAEQFNQIALSNNIDVGDHRSNSSGIAGTPTIADCTYCNYIKNHFYDSKISNYRITYKSKNFFVMPGLGQFLNGYFLIIPFKHIMSSAELETPELLSELLQVIEDIKYILKITYGTNNILVWENGTGNGGYGKAKDSIVHAHIHLVPSSLSPQAIQKTSGFSFKEITSNEIMDFGERSYLLLKGDNSWFINDDPELYIPRQYIRQLLADEHQLKDGVWNWREYMFTDKIIETMRDVNNALKTNWVNLPNRIKHRVEPYINNV